MLKKLLNLLFTDPMRIPIQLWSRIYISLLSSEQNIELKGKIIINGKPLIDIRRGSFLYIDNGVTLNSRNRGYHINMHSPVKLFADRPDALIRIGENTRIHGTCIHAHKSIEIGRNCLIAANCQIFDNNGHELSFPDVKYRLNTKGLSKPIFIEDNVWIGANSIILPGVTIGQGSVISASSVVTKDIPPMVLAGGNPARIIKDHSILEDQNG